MNQHSLDFVKGLFQNGLNESQVRHTLANAGFSPENIDSLIAAYKMPVNQTSAPMPPLFAVAAPPPPQPSTIIPSAPWQQVAPLQVPTPPETIAVKTPTQSKTIETKRIVITFAVIIFSLTGISLSVWLFMKDRSISRALLAPVSQVATSKPTTSKESEFESVAPVAPQPKTADETYLDFKRAAQSAKDSAEFMAVYDAFLSSRALSSDSYKKDRNDFAADKQQADMVFAFIKSLKLEPSADKITVSERNQENGLATLKLAGEGYVGEAVMIDENGFWKLDKETWTDSTGGTSSLAY